MYGVTVTLMLLLSILFAGINTDDSNGTASSSSLNAVDTTPDGYVEFFPGQDNGPEERGPIVEIPSRQLCCLSGRRL